MALEALEYYGRCIIAQNHVLNDSTLQVLTILDRFARQQLGDYNMKLQPHINRVLDNPNVLHVFGLILFTDEHPYVVKVLRDEDYWKEFDKMSGDSLAIFSAKPRRGAYDMPAPRPADLHYMVQIWQEPVENEELLSTFHLRSTEYLPKFVVFAQMPDDSILQCSLPLTNENEQAAYRRLRDIIRLVSGAARGIAEQYKSDTENVYNAFVLQIAEFKCRERIIRACKWIPFLSKVLKMLKAD